ncbi:hypothetical protein [Asticcacaulis sp. AC402]|uniref:hypothetical protein n=1 Tax=Asticcacaulis sp. AC402 TaxID=1282361 RepID=UPI0003C3BF46|nr:hypothetical protein [Asticcacaulis sp. AC402]ESQ77729.1 hypothetical protein ABAC402_00945 [Asticcacaulis sp. AC402]
MSVIMRLMELVSDSHRLKNSKPYVLRALAGMAVFVMLGVFAAVMAALLVASLLWLIYAQMLEAGAAISTAGPVAGGLALVTIGLTTFAALRTWAAVRADIDLVFHAQTPVVSKVADRVGRVADSFVSGLRGRQASQ